MKDTEISLSKLAREYHMHSGSALGYLTEAGVAPLHELQLGKRLYRIYDAATARAVLDQGAAQKPPQSTTGALSEATLVELVEAVQENNKLLAQMCDILLERVTAPVGGTV